MNDDPTGDVQPASTAQISNSEQAFDPVNDFDFTRCTWECPSSFRKAEFSAAEENASEDEDQSGEGASENEDHSGGKASETEDCGYPAVCLDISAAAALFSPDGEKKDQHSARLEAFVRSGRVIEGDVDDDEDTTTIGPSASSPSLCRRISELVMDENLFGYGQSSSALCQADFSGSRRLRSDSRDLGTLLGSIMVVWRLSKLFGSGRCRSEEVIDREINTAITGSEEEIEEARTIVEILAAAEMARSVLRGEGDGGFLARLLQQLT
ncbi:hypothetical protein CONLIGDRAFT_677993 [Coniochaeta ligniaria NRRL 30616]|uniref:Uncharacterized protein n=1 Tax=Coniochaeta ligniaria NRRL 30616 TaxID=1408157 RepID=A0A1J7JNQ8_9PEZI|nr:hypothetical protein CONLIGDRAFT_677993 [Coniochaeta ligniaria NRRL 30616]